MEAITARHPGAAGIAGGGRVCSLIKAAGLSELELKSAAYDLIQRLERAGAHITFRAAILDYAIGVGLRVLRCGTSW